MSVEVVIPWRDGCEARRQALRWVWERYKRTYPEWQLTLGIAPDGEWVKALAVMPSIARSKASVIVVADADVWVDGLGDAVYEVERDQWWAVPHMLVNRLSERATNAVFAGLEPVSAAPYGLDQSPYVGVEGGGVVVIKRQLALDVPLDPRFRGWGGEDHAWGYALSSFVGPPWRAKNDLWHLWHPPQRRWTRKVGSRPSEELRRRYRDARSHPADMRALIGEAVEEGTWQ